MLTIHIPGMGAKTSRLPAPGVGSGIACQNAAPDGANVYVAVTGQMQEILAVIRHVIPSATNA
jgi:hypothetical protein